MPFSASFGFELARRLSGEASLRGAVGNVLGALLQIPGIDAGGVYLLDEASGGIELVAHRGLSDAFVERVRVYGPDDPHVVVPRSGQPIFVWHDALEASHGEVRAEGITSVAIVPVLHEGQLVAVLNAASHTDEELDSATQTALISLAAVVGGAIARVSAEEALRASQVKAMAADRLGALGQLAAGIAHEINNPLAYIVANLDFALEHLALAQAEGLDDVRLALAEARSGAKAVREIAGDLRALARDDEGVEATADVAEALRKALNLARSAVRHRARIASDVGELPRVDGAESRLSQVFLNLLVNAAQALPEGPADAHVVSARARTDATGRACVEIRDTGSGIAPEVLPRIFDPFFTTKAPSVGTGLGLAICHSVVTSLGGTIEVETEVGVGTCFRVIFPPARRRVAPPVRSSVPPPSSIDPKRVLIIDDEPFVAGAARRLLRGHTVEVVAGGEAAVARLEAGSDWDVVLCDLMMPGIDGPALHAQIRERWPHLVPRFVVMTGGAFTDRARDFLEREAPTVLHKPFDAASLRGLVALVASRPAR